MSEHTVALVRPRRSLITTAIVSLLLAMIPSFGVLYAVGASNGTWVGILVAHCVVIAICGGILIRQLTVHTRVTATHIQGNGIFTPMVVVPLADVHQALIVKTFTGDSPDTVEQLLLRDESGHRLYRMRGNYYEPGILQEVAAALPIETCVVDEAMPVKRFFSEYPGAEYWFENKPALRIIWIPVGILLALAVAALIAGLSS